ncbi:hypothetical protein GCM10028862_12660 [Luteimonas pelagia]
MGRTLLAVVCGIVVAWITITLVQMAGHAIWPPPADLDPMDPAQLDALVSTLPVGALAMVVVAWLAGAFTGGFTAAKLSLRHPRAAAAIIGAFVVVGVIAMVTMIPAHPYWVSIPGLLLPIPVALLGARVARPRPVTAARPY